MDGVCHLGERLLDWLQSVGDALNDQSLSPLRALLKTQDVLLSVKVAIVSVGYTMVAPGFL